MKLLVAAVLVASAATTAAAQPSSGAGKSATVSDGESLAAQACARARKMHKECVLTFGADEIDGRLVSPNGTDLSTRDITIFASMIRLRTDFRAEIIESVDWI